MARHSINAFRSTSAAPAVCVVGYQAEEVMAALGADNFFVRSEDAAGGNAFAAFKNVLSGRRSFPFQKSSKSFPAALDSAVSSVSRPHDRRVLRILCGGVLILHRRGRAGRAIGFDRP